MFCKYIATLILLLSFVNAVQSQKVKSRLSLEFTLGLEAGWWIYDRGTLDNGQVVSSLGWDRSHYVSQMPVAIRLSGEFSKFIAGFRVAYRWFYENEMIQYDDTWLVREKYKISKNSVRFKQYGLIFGYQVFKKEKYIMAPMLGAGIFKVKTLHPERSTFGSQKYFQIAINNSINKGTVEWVISPKYTQLTILPKKEVASNGKHKIHSLGIETGIKFWLK